MRRSRNWPSSFNTAKMTTQTSPTGEERPPQSTGAAAASSLLRNIGVFPVLTLLSLSLFHPFCPWGSAGTSSKCTACFHHSVVIAAAWGRVRDALNATCLCSSLSRLLEWRGGAPVPVSERPTLALGVVISGVPPPICSPSALVLRASDQEADFSEVELFPPPPLYADTF